MTALTDAKIVDISARTGKRPYRLTPEGLAKKRAAWQSPERREKLRAAMNRPEVREKLRAAMSARMKRLWELAKLGASVAHPS